MFYGYLRQCNWGSAPDPGRRSREPLSSANPLALAYLWETIPYRPADMAHVTKPPSDWARRPCAFPSEYSPTINKIEPPTMNASGPEYVAIPHATRPDCAGSSGGVWCT